MKIAVIGAGVIGITSAYELARDGHDVVVFEKAAAAAEGASFGTSGLMSPSLSLAFSHPAWPQGRWLRRIFESSPIEIGRQVNARDLSWLARWKTASASQEFNARIAQSAALCTYAQERLTQIAGETGIEFETSSGHLVVYRSEQDASKAEAKLATLKDMGIVLRDVQAAEARLLEPGLHADLSYARAVYFPNDGVANCRQFALALRAKTQEMGVQYRFGAHVEQLAMAAILEVKIRNEAQPESFDHVVICAGVGSAQLTHQAKLLPPITTLTGYTFSATIKEPLNAPRSAVLDAHEGTSIVRLGNRVRVSTGAELGVPLSKIRQSSVKKMFDTLLQYFPGAAKFSSGTQIWKGASGLSNDGAPYIGPTHAAGVWVNTGHGPNGWGMACGAARLVADAIGKKDTLVDASLFSPQRL